jgi:predicted LPLAT superfamily acyltransferase
MNPVPPPAGPAAPEWLTTRERSNRLALQLMAWIATRCGRPVARLLLHPVALYFLLMAPRQRRHSARYLGRALGRPATWVDSYRHFHSFASVVLDRVYFARDQMQLFQLDVQGGPAVDACLAEGRGAFLLGAHLGSFEAMHAIGATRPGMRVAMVMFPDNARLIQQVLQAIAPAFRLNIIPIGRRGSTLAIRDWLDGNGLAGFLGDRYLPTEVPRDGRRPDSVVLPFLGAPARFTDGPLRLAQLLRRRVLFMAGLYQGGPHYDLRFEVLADFSQPSDDPAEREQALQRALGQYVQRLEALCREAPYNWFNFYDFWQEHDAGAAPADVAH